MVDINLLPQNYRHKILWRKVNLFFIIIILFIFPSLIIFNHIKSSEIDNLRAEATILKSEIKELDNILDSLQADADLWDLYQQRNSLIIQINEGAVNWSEIFNYLYLSKLHDIRISNFSSDSNVFLLNGSSERMENITSFLEGLDASPLFSSIEYSEITYQNDIFFFTSNGEVLSTHEENTLSQ